MSENSVKKLVMGIEIDNFEHRVVRLRINKTDDVKFTSGERHGWP